MENSTNSRVTEFRADATIQNTQIGKFNLKSFSKLMLFPYFFLFLITAAVAIVYYNAIRLYRRISL